MMTTSHALEDKYNAEEDAKKIIEHEETKTSLEKLPNPTGWRILVMPFKVKEKTEGGIIIAQETLDRARVSTQVGYVLKMGDLCYQDKDRYHLSLAGTYEYTVGDEKIIVEPGTFFWFYNKIPHSAINVGEVDRVTLVWDVPHNKKNPHHSSR